MNYEISSLQDFRKNNISIIWEDLAELTCTKEYSERFFHFLFSVQLLNQDSALSKQKH